MICDWVEAECTEEYLQECYDKTKKVVSRSRNVNLVVWTAEVRNMVEKSINICTLSFMSIRLPQISCCLAVLYYYLNTMISVPCLRKGIATNLSPYI